MMNCNCNQEERGCQKGGLVDTCRAFNREWATQIHFNGAQCRNRKAPNCHLSWIRLSQQPRPWPLMWGHSDYLIQDWTWNNYHKTWWRGKPKSERNLEPLAMTAVDLGKIRILESWVKVSVLAGTAGWWFWWMIPLLLFIYPRGIPSHPERPQGPTSQKFFPGTGKVQSF